jgi:hydrogenase maturation protein HypF
VARAMKIAGWVSNGNDGVHIKFNADKEQAAEFYKKIISEAPANAIIRSHCCTDILEEKFIDFSIKQSDASVKPDLLLTPDIAICSHCREEIADKSNKRFQYPFTTCLECGPRFSIITALPYDRENTTMATLKMCNHCSEEYKDIDDQRHYSQTNSCSHCSVPLLLFDNQGTEISHDAGSILLLINQALHEGNIIAVKGIGGYLLICDATKTFSIKNLRERKHRPAKPFAVMYPSVAMMEKDLLLTVKEKEALRGKAAPIVLCKLKEKPASGICTKDIAPGLDKIGAMLPYTALLELIAVKWGKPLLATSGNLSGSPIIYTDEDALLWLSDQADLILSFERDIVMPQDDSVMQFAAKSQQLIILRRSRGLAPNYFPAPFDFGKSILAMGAEMKSSFAIINNGNFYVSQYLGDQSNYESQVSYKNTLHHLLNLLQVKPEQVIIDSHPNYFVSHLGNALAEEWNIPVETVQHHKAHFCAVLAENALLNNKEHVLGAVWDGTGYGEDEQIWGGEFFILEDGGIERYMHLDYFPQLLGDKMSKEPRVSAVALLRNNMDHLMMIKDQFSIAEREFYLKLLQQKQTLLTSSMGRLLDGIASILKIQSINSYEGEAAMKLEAAARSCTTNSYDYYSIPVNNTRLDWSVMINEIMMESINGVDTAAIARKVFVSLAMLIKNIAVRAGVKKIAFSGGVFQNAFLVDLISELLNEDFKLYFHRQLSPNDECIGFGQIGYARLFQKKEKKHTQQLQMINH